MNGDITVNTAPGKGTEFIVTIPLEKLDDEEIKKIQSDSGHKKELEVDFSNKRVILADDILVNRQIAKKLLEKVGFKVEEAENGQDAVNMLAASDDGYYDAVLMDIQMPVMDGYEATKAIRKMTDDRKKNIPVIAMTANAFSEDIRKAKEAGMNAHVAKPIDVKKMVQTLSEVLGGDNR